MQVALDAAALALGAGGDPRARPADLGQRSRRLGRQPLVVEHDARHRHAGLDELGPRVERCVVDDRRDGPAAVVHPADRAPVAGRRQCQRPAVRVDPGAVEREGHLQ